MSKKSWFFIFAIPVVIVILLFVYFQGKSKPVSTPVANNVDNTVTPPPATVAPTPTVSALPQFPSGSAFVQQVIPNYGPTLIRYMFTGKIRQLNTVSGGTQLVMDISDPNFPSLVIKSDTRISKINSVTKVLTPATVGDLRTGMILDLTVDYEKNNKQWLFRDIYIPSDRN